MSIPLPRKGRLPRTYWPIMFVWLSFWGLVGIAVAWSVGVNPYVGFMVGWCAPLFIEVALLRREGR